MKKAVTQLVFTLVLLVLFIVLFGHPAVTKFLTDEVFIKISSEPQDRASIVDIPLPAVTLCGSDVASVISQVELQKEVFAKISQSRRKPLLAPSRAFSWLKPPTSAFSFHI